MSWQAYTDNLIATSFVDKAAIYSAAGDSVWAESNALGLYSTEIQEIAKGFQSPEILQSKGLHVKGEKYFLIKADERSIYGRQEKSGLICVKTKQAILVGHYPEGVQPGDATKVVEQLADYLISVNY
ncbi:profilin [Saccharomycopsis crataegensis]|uniref:Profilin n=1 Tax=Saccharomycopsis crataegensis TaxID=43959 RepID=A0AAV5QFQ8_9ASCO|nr:profilin [Saccharomycopsis crataegensis]